MPTHIPLALPACPPASGELPLPEASEVEGGHLGMRGGDSRVWTPQGWHKARETRPTAASWGAGWGPRLEQRMPGFSAQAGDGVMEKGGRVYTEGRGAAGGEQLTRAALFQALERVGQQGDAPHLHPAAPFIHALPSTPPQL